MTALQHAPGAPPRQERAVLDPDDVTRYAFVRESLLGVDKHRSERGHLTRKERALGREILVDLVARCNLAELAPLRAEVAKHRRGGIGLPWRGLERLLPQ